MTGLRITRSRADTNQALRDAVELLDDWHDEHKDPVKVPQQKVPLPYEEFAWDIMRKRKGLPSAA